MKIRIGDTVTAELFGGTIVTGDIVNIEICEPGEKYGDPVGECDTDAHENGVISMDNKHWCYFNQIKSVENHVYLVSAYYDMNIGTDEEIILEIYANEEDAQRRVAELIGNFKNGSHSIEDCEQYGGEWDESEYRLYAYMDSEWNVDISYKEDVVR